MCSSGLKQWTCTVEKACLQLKYTNCTDFEALRQYYLSYGYELHIIDEPVQPADEVVNAPKSQGGTEQGKVAKRPYHFANNIPNAVEAYRIIYDNEQQNISQWYINADKLRFDGCAYLTHRGINTQGEEYWSGKLIRSFIKKAATYFGEKFKFYEGLDYYITANTFFLRGEKGNKKPVVSCLNNLVIDVDCHMEGYSAEQICGLISDYTRDVQGYLETNNLSLFNLVHYTPRGAHFWYHLVQDSVKMEKWYISAVERITNAFSVVKRINEKYSVLDVDVTASKRMDGWFRAFGSGGEITILHDNAFDLKELNEIFKEYTTKTVYSTDTFNDIQPGVNLVEPVTAKPEPPAEEVQPSEDSKRRRLECYNHRLLNGMRQRLNIIEWGIENGKATEGNRDKYLFMAYNTAIVLYNKWSDAKKYVIELNAKLDKPLTDKYIQTYIFNLFTRRLNDYNNGVSTEPPAYHYKFSDFLEMLSITNADYEAFQKVGTRKCVRESKRNAKADRNKQIIQMKLKGKTNAEISAVTGVCEKTIRNVVNRYYEEQKQREKTG